MTLKTLCLGAGTALIALMATSAHAESVGLTLARQLLSRQHGTKQIIMVTDGEPTAHLEGEEVFFAWPPVRETIHRTLSEAVRLARAGVTLNLFMLEDAPGLTRFMERLARLTAGRVFLMSSGSLGDFVLRDYVRRRAS
jgi:uncharacterized protein with von Willebrand factor type A (vWA) domain